MNVKADMELAYRAVFYNLVRSSCGRIMPEHQAITFSVSPISIGPENQYMATLTGYVENNDEEAVDMMQDIIDDTMVSVDIFNIKTQSNIIIDRKDPVFLSSEDGVIFQRRDFDLRHSE